MGEKKKYKRYGLLGKDIGYSFSRGYFTEKFEALKIKNSEYVNFDLSTIEDFDVLVENNKSELHGMNVTIPYKEAVIPYLDKIDKTVSTWYLFFIRSLRVLQYNQLAINCLYPFFTHNRDICPKLAKGNNHYIFWLCICCYLAYF